VEGGSSADATIYTLGWGGVRRLPMAKPQWGFYGKFLRYRRFEDETHGVHHGLSVGTESGAARLRSRSARPARSAITGWASLRLPSRSSCRSGFRRWERVGDKGIPASAPAHVTATRDGVVEPAKPQAKGEAGSAPASESAPVHQ
jgi:hypothetical protein